MAKIGATIRNIITAVFKGELLLRLHVDKYFVHIISLFVLILAAVWISLKVDTTLTKVEKNKKVIHELEIYHAEMTSELVELGRLSTVEAHLQELGSDVAMPEKPAVAVKRR